jgi:hypothetical protein
MHPLRSQTQPAGGGAEGDAAAGAALPPAGSEALGELLDPKPAHSLIAKLEAQRQANGGFVLAPPPAQVLEAVGREPVRTPTGSEFYEPNAAATRFLDWAFNAFEAGASADELWRGWQMVCPRGSGPVRSSLRWNGYRGRESFDALYQRARRRDSELAQAAEREAEPERALAQMRTNLAETRRRQQKAELEAADIAAAADRQERAIEAFLEQHPHLKPPETQAA